MSKEDLENTKAWVQRWKRASEELAKIRASEIVQADTKKAILALTSNFQWALRTMPLRKGSGLVKQQKLFAKLRQT